MTGDGAAPELAPSQQTVADEVFSSCAWQQRTPGFPRPSDRQPTPAANMPWRYSCAGMLNRRMYRIGLEALPTRNPKIENLARLWQREVCCWRSRCMSKQTSRQRKHRDGSRIQLVPVTRDRPVFVSLREAPPRSSYSAGTVEVNKPTAREQYGPGSSHPVRRPKAEDAANAAQAARRPVQSQLAGHPPGDRAAAQAPATETSGRTHLDDA